jgi:hypothetical protein
MPATLSKSSRESAFVSTEGWHAALKAINPLSEWRHDFAEWRKDIEHFRDFESQAFFPDRESEILRRMHRGMLCQLMSTGELLAFDLLNKEQLQSAEDEFKFLNLLLENLQQTLDTWHSAARLDLLKEQQA